MDKEGKHDAKCTRKVMNDRKVTDLANARGINLEWAWLLQKGALVLAIIYGSETKVWIKRYKPKVQSVCLVNPEGRVNLKTIAKMRNDCVRGALLMWEKAWMREYIN